MTTMEQIFQRPAALPTISTVVLDLYEMTKDSAVPLSSIVKIIIADQVLAAKVLRTANSAYFGRSGSVSRIEDAISTIGIHTLRTTIITNGLMKAIPEAQGIDMPAYWRMGLHTAFMASHLAAQTDHDRDEAFTTGLMQGLGVLLIHLVMPEEASQVIQHVAPLDFMKRRAIERDLLGFDNAEVAAELLKRWNFPGAIQKALLTYSNFDPRPDKLGQLLSVSSAFAYGVVSGLDESSVAERVDPNVIFSFGLSQEWWDASRDRVSASVNLMI
ncbi:HDOD domain-containing protein [Pseudomonas fluorescens]|uniref:HDOD domain-containing protein n=1 Tax=Pseudomonas fluorescens TaxID=294 RepID=A0A5E7QDH4_PSEFL|nr:HDOD domain-containing protein [Pseudomonas fluorescens]VVP59658.1 hypothetical protein PS880_06055 [Pseudomonas fluorescens]